MHKNTSRYLFRFASFAAELSRPLLVRTNDSKPEKLTAWKLEPRERLKCSRHSRKNSIFYYYLSPSFPEKKKKNKEMNSEFNDHFKKN